MEKRPSAAQPSQASIGPLQATWCSCTSATSSFDEAIFTSAIAGFHLSHYRLFSLQFPSPANTGLHAHTGLLLFLNIAAFGNSNHCQVFTRHMPKINVSIFAIKTLIAISNSLLTNCRKAFQLVIAAVAQLFCSIGLFNGFCNLMPWIELCPAPKKERSVT